jgi:hypothetical protein
VVKGALLGGVIGNVVNKVPLVGPALIVGSSVYEGYNRVQEGETTGKVIMEESVRTASTVAVCSASQWVGGILGAVGGPVGVVAGIAAGSVVCGALADGVSQAAVDRMSQEKQEGIKELVSS